jgi:hypothetical protein
MDLTLILVCGIVGAVCGAIVVVIVGRRRRRQ